MQFRSISLGFVTALVACGQPAAPDQIDVALDVSALGSTNGLTTNGLTTNGLTTNGLTTNGLTTNGLTTNGLTTNGLTTNGLATAAMAQWFEGTPSSPAVMSYLARCALAAGDSITYVSNGVTYTWNGVLGLAPGWHSGPLTNPIEQELISACLAAHVNKYGVHVGISVRGRLADGSYLAVEASEAADYNQDEGCFFGNIFTGEGVFSAFSTATPMMNVWQSSERACVAERGETQTCGRMISLGLPVQTACTAEVGHEGAFEYSTCRYGLHDYRTICVRLRADEIATCGDGVCQPPETNLNCVADCH